MDGHRLSTCTVASILNRYHLGSNTPGERERAGPLHGAKRQLPFPLHLLLDDPKERGDIVFRFTAVVRVPRDKLAFHLLNVDSWNLPAQAIELRFRQCAATA